MAWPPFDHFCNLDIDTLKSQVVLGVVAHIFNPSTLEAETGRSLSLRPA